MLRVRGCPALFASEKMLSVQEYENLTWDIFDLSDDALTEHVAAASDVARKLRTTGEKEMCVLLILFFFRVVFHDFDLPLLLLYIDCRVLSPSAFASSESGGNLPM